MKKSCLITVLVFSLFTSLSLNVFAENITRSGDYTIHHNALATATLLPEVARAYQIKRSKNRGMINIVVQHRGKSTPAKVTGTGSNLNAQLKHLSFREINDGDVTYYIADFRVTDKEIINFKVNVTPEGSSGSHEISFRQGFYTR